jgi:pyruvate kinase
VPTTYRNLSYDVKAGDRVLIDDGKIEMHVVDKNKTDVRCKVVNGGMLSSHKGLNLPLVAISTPALTDKDKRDLNFGIKHGIDYCALSFVRSSDDIAQLKKYISKRTKRNIQVIAKIEKQEALNDIDDIIKVSDGVIVARGDLGVEVSLEKVPLVQKMIVAKCRELGKPAIVATQMLESMINQPRPTRAEVSDIANAALDGADALLLSGETSVGKFPVEAVKIMNSTIKAVEKRLMTDYKVCDLYDSLASSAVMLSDKLHASAIVAVTHSGETAVRVAKYRPAAPIYAVTESDSVSSKLNLVWGVKSLVVRKLKNNTDTAFKKIQAKLLTEGMINKGSLVVVLAGLPLFEKNVLNTIKVYRVE